MQSTFRNQTRRRNAFTLIEILVVLAVLGVLIGITFGVSRAVEAKRNHARVELDLLALTQALEAYKNHYGDYPWISPGEGPRSLYRALNGERGPRGDQISGRVFIEHSRFALNDPDDMAAADNHFLDPWGQPYEYYYREATAGVPSASWENPRYVLFSKGPDRVAADFPNDGFPDKEALANRDNIYAK